MRCGLAGEQEVPALLTHRLADRLAGIKIVAEIDRVQPFVAGAMALEPAPHGAALAVLLVVTVLRPDELRLERHPLGMAPGAAWVRRGGGGGGGRLGSSGVRAGPARGARRGGGRGWVGGLFRGRVERGGQRFCVGGWSRGPSGATSGCEPSR